MVGGATVDGWLAYFQLKGNVALEANRITLPNLAAALRREMDLPVVDQTGLKGFYEVSLPVPGLWLRRSGSAEASEPSGVNLSKSLEKVGLKLEKGKAPIEHLVVDHAEKAPTGN